MLRVVARPAKSEDNPYCQLLYAQIRQLGIQVEDFSNRELLDIRYDIYHLHWPECYAVSSSKRALRATAKTLRMLSTLSLLRGMGIKVLWTAHNVHSHERRFPYLEKLFWFNFIRSVDGVICMSKATKEKVIDSFPILRLKKIPIAVIPHGHYRDAYPNYMTYSEARKKLKIDLSNRVFTFLGLLRSYKNILHLLDTFSMLQGDSYRLLIAGFPREALLGKQITFRASQDRRIQLYLEFIPNEDLQIYLNASDLIVLPFSEVFNSGSALLALSFNRPILVPHQGSLPELQERVGSDWVQTYNGDLNPILLQQAMKWAIETRREQTVFLDCMNWTTIAKETSAFYRRLMA